MPSRWHNPIAFTPLPVTIITSIVYVALIVVLLVIHLVDPPTPNTPTPSPGINLTEAWLDLKTLTDGYHPYNSHRNDEVREWLLKRIEDITGVNGAHSPRQHFSWQRRDRPAKPEVSTGSNHVFVFSDAVSNVTFSSPGKDPRPAPSIYFEGTNILVYIRGSEDDPEDWWDTGKTPQGRGGVLVNAHYDSVSTGFGASDDGIGVVTVLQLIKYFTTEGHRPKKGLVALFNNGEEDYLNGARAFTQHPLSHFAHTFLNLEGAGAGGRACLFRSTDTEVTRPYGRSKHPFATVVSGDAFEMGIIRSQTDYVVFNGVLGLRGLDVAFIEPRSRYHTDEDDARHTSPSSLWHMLSASLATIQGLTSDTSSQFDSEDKDDGKVPSGKGSTGVWFDLFGQAFAVFQLQTLFIISVTLLVTVPVILLTFGYALHRADKLYLFSSSTRKEPDNTGENDKVFLQGWRGISRYPIVFILSGAAVIALAFLVARLNPYIVYSSPYAIWTMMLSAWLFVFWFLMDAASWLRPSALHRTYAALWMFVGGWILLVFVTVLERKYKIASGYFMAIYFAAISVATAIGLLELFGLPPKSSFASEHPGGGEPASRDRGRSASPTSPPSGRMLGPTEEQNADGGDADENQEEEADESTSLLAAGRRQTRFSHYTSPDRNHPVSEQEDDTAASKRSKPYGREQIWSSSLPRWTWLLQFLFLAPIVIIVVGQIALLFVTATYQTLADGNSPVQVYLGTAVFTILILAPLSPFLHRYTYHIPTFLFLAFAGTLIYNLLAFPFSSNSRLKLYFVQNYNLDIGNNSVVLTGLTPYLQTAIHSLPSAAGQSLDCATSPIRKGLTDCSWQGLDPRVVQPPNSTFNANSRYQDWLSFSVLRLSNDSNSAHFRVRGRDTRACKLQFDDPIWDFRVRGAGKDERFKRVSEHGSKEIRLWSRTWDREWEGDVWWGKEPKEKRDEQSILQEGDDAGLESTTSLNGRVVCLWSDDNRRGVIPALDEIRRFAPAWVAVTKNADGLVEGSKAFSV